MAVEKTARRIRRNIISFLVDRPDGCTKNDICAHVIGRSQIIRKALRDLLGEALVVRGGYGTRSYPYLYYLNPSWSADVKSVAVQDDFPEVHEYKIEGGECSDGPEIEVLTI
jgi:hypothetical protein